MKTAQKKITVPHGDLVTHSLLTCAKMVSLPGKGEGIKAVDSIGHSAIMVAASMLKSVGVRDSEIRSSLEKTLAYFNAEDN